jgi:hypothetical protein
MHTEPGRCSQTWRSDSRLHGCGNRMSSRTPSCADEARCSENTACGSCAISTMRRTKVIAVERPRAAERRVRHPECHAHSRAAARRCRRRAMPNLMFRRNRAVLAHCALHRRNARGRTWGNGGQHQRCMADTVDARMTPAGTVWGYADRLIGADRRQICGYSATIRPLWLGRLRHRHCCRLWPMRCVFPGEAGGDAESVLRAPASRKARPGRVATAGSQSLTDDERKPRQRPDIDFIQSLAWTFFIIA